MLELLANQRRRFALYALSDAADDVTTLDAVIEEVLTLETALRAEAITRDRCIGIATDLYHWHLPVLADVGIIDCDSRQGMIRYLPHPPLETWIERVRTHELDGR